MMQKLNILNESMSKLTRKEEPDSQEITLNNIEINEIAQTRKQM